MSERVEEFTGDVRVMKLCVEHDVPITGAVLESVWRWFPDVEIVLPIPVMPLTSGEWKTFTLDILGDLHDASVTMGGLVDEQDKFDDDDIPDELSDRLAAQAAHLDMLWRELAGCLADKINATVPVYTEEEKRKAVASFLEQLSEELADSEEELLSFIRTDSRLRMYFRMNGLNPDDFA